MEDFSAQFWLVPMYRICLVDQMANEKSVNVTAQIIMMFIPFAWIWAFYRIDKFWQGLGLFALGIVIGFMVAMIFGATEAIYEIAQYGELLSEEVSEGTENLSYVVSFIVASVIGVYFIRKWSIEWNDQILKT